MKCEERASNPHWLGRRFGEKNETKTKGEVERYQAPGALAVGVG